MTGRSALLLAGASVPMVVGLGAWGASIDPGHPQRWIFVACFSPGFWAFFEWAQAGERSRERAAIISWHRCWVAWLGLMVLLSFGPRLALDAGLIDVRGRAVASSFQWVVAGVCLVLWGNLLPKLLSPWQREDEPFDWQGVHRFVGWAAALAGLAIVAAWSTFPPAQARRGSVAVLGAFALLALGRKFASVASHRRLPRRGEQAGGEST